MNCNQSKPSVPIVSTIYSQNKTLKIILTKTFVSYLRVHNLPIRRVSPLGQWSLQTWLHLSSPSYLWLFLQSARHKVCRCLHLFGSQLGGVGYRLPNWSWIGQVSWFTSQTAPGALSWCPCHAAEPQADNRGQCLALHNCPPSSELCRTTNNISLNQWMDLMVCKLLWMVLVEWF